MSKDLLEAEEHLTLCEALDRVLNKGAVIHGDIKVSVADIDLLYLGLRLILTSIETAMRTGAIFPGENPGRHGVRDASE